MNDETVSNDQPLFTAADASNLIAKARNQLLADALDIPTLNTILKAIEAAATSGFNYYDWDASALRVQQKEAISHKLTTLGFSVVPGYKSDIPYLFTSWPSTNATGSPG